MAAVLWSTSALFARSPLFDPWPVEHRGAAIALWRAVFALVILVPLIRRLSWDWRMVPMAGAFALMNWTYLTALVGGPPENAIWLQNLAPAWVMLVAVVVLREPTVRKDWWMLSLCIGGVIFILALQNASPMTTARHYWWAPWLAIASGICYAGVILSLRSLRSHDPAWLIALNHAVTALLMCPLVWNSGVGWPQENMWFLLAGIGMIQMGTPYLLFARGLKSTPSHLASLITLLEPVLLPVWVFLARGSDPDYEPAPWWTWVGASMILLGLMIRYWPVPIDGARPHGRSRSQGEP
jgi:drug/metabolite transporter (DMT)-like permease